MEPQTPDPVTAANTLLKIPERVRTLSRFFARAHRKATPLPDWRVHQVSSFIKYVELYAADVNETYRTDRLDSLAQAIHRKSSPLQPWEIA